MLLKLLIFLFFAIPETRQETISIVNITNFGTLKISLSRNHKIVRYNYTPYFEGDGRDAYLVFTEQWNVWADLYIFYDESKINKNSNIKGVGGGYDKKISLLNTDRLYLSLKQNIGYLVFADFNFDGDSFKIQFFHMNEYYNISKYNSYYFSFPQSNFYFTFSYKKNNINIKNLLSYVINEGHTAKTTLYNKNKALLKETSKLYGGFSFIDYNDVDEFFIKIQITGGGAFNINFLMDDYPNLYCLTQRNNIIKFNLTSYPSYIFYIDITNVPEDKINFLSKWSSMDNTYVYYYSTNLVNIEEIKSEFLYRFKDKTKRIVDGSTYVSYDKFTIPITIPTNATKKLVFIMYPKLKDTEYYIKAIFFSPKEIYTNWNYSVVLDSKKNYQIFNYKQYRFYNNSLNGFIYSVINEPDKDCSLYIYDDLGNLFLDDIRNNPVNLKEKNWKSFNYTSGDIYFVITNFKLVYPKTYTFSINNNNDYSDISDDIEKYSNYSFYMKFNDTQNQYLTFTLYSHKNYYIYFDIMPSNLKTSVSTLTFENKALSPIDDKYYLINTIDKNIRFKILLSSKNNFSEFNVKVNKIDNLPNSNYIKKLALIGIIILGGIQIVMFIVYIIKYKKNREKGGTINNSLMINYNRHI